MEGEFNLYGFVNINIPVLLSRSESTQGCVLDYKFEMKCKGL